MKLRNKKTGRVVNFRHIAFDEPKDDRENYRYSSLAEFNEEWEDCTQKEPLIKDEKIRKAVRAWAEAVDADSAFVEKWAYDGDQFVLSDELAEIHFRIKTPKEIKLYKRYTITELCGEEEE